MMVSTPHTPGVLPSGRGRGANIRLGEELYHEKRHCVFRWTAVER